MSATLAGIELEHWTKSTESYKQRVCEIAKLLLKKEHAKFEQNGDNNGGKLTKEIDAACREVKLAFPEKVMAFGIDLETVAALMYEVAAQLPLGYMRDKSGRVCIEPRDSESDPEPICSGLRIVAETRSLKDRRAGMIVEVNDRHSGWREVEYEQADLLSRDKSLTPFVDAGLKIQPDRHKRVVALLHAATSSKLILMADQVGWAKVDGQHVFVTPEKVYAPRTLAVRFERGGDYKIGQKGTLGDWQDTVGKYARDNSRVEFAVCLSFAAPLLEPLNIEGGGFHLFGHSSRGKTTALQCGASVIGDGHEMTGYLQRLKGSTHGPEVFGFKHNDVPFFGDESAQTKDAFALTYDLANGQASQRMTKDIEARERKTWRSLSLLSGEDPLPVLIKKQGQVMAPGQRVRFPDVPADLHCKHGVFDHLHGFESGGDFSKKLKQACCANYGTTFDGFMTRLVEERAQVVADRDRIDIIAKSFVDAADDGQVQRIADRFALVAFAGELAIAWGVLKWPKGTAIKAAQRMFNDYREARGETRYPQAVIDGARNIMEAIRVHGASRFQPKGLEVVHGRLGFREDDSPLDPGAKTRYYIFAAKFSELAGTDAAAVARYFKDRGELCSEKDRLTVKAPFRLDHERAPCYCIEVPFDRTVDAAPESREPALAE